MNFAAIDFETANAKLSSICQIGVAIFENGLLKEQWGTLVNPEDYFDAFNVAIHGIDENAVASAPSIPSIHSVFLAKIKGKPLVSHTMFDQCAARQCFQKYGLPILENAWIDSAKVARRVWPEFSNSGYGLKNLAKHLKIEFYHHKADEDARAAGEILIKAIGKSGFSLDDWILKSTQPISPASINLEGNPEGPLFGEVVVFTGALSIHRNEAAQLAAAAGCKVSATVNKATTALIVGDQDIRQLVGHEKSSKHRKAEELILQGQQIRILGESDFKSLISQR